MSANFDGREVLLPTVSDDGRIMSDDEAIDLYRRTGRNLGAFDSPDHATAYAQSLHSAQERQYVPQDGQSGPWTKYRGEPAPLEIDIVGGRPNATPNANNSAFARIISGAPAPQEGGLGRNLGMSARSVLQGAGGLMGALGGDAFNHFLTPGEQPSYRDAASALADKLGLPAPQTSGERVYNDIGEALTGTGLTMGAGGLASAAAKAPGALASLGEFLTAQPGLQAVSTVTGSGAGALAREGGAGTGGQLAAALAGGLAPGAITSLPAMAARGLVRGTSPEAMLERIGQFDAAGVTPSVGQATGNRGVQSLESMLGSVPGGAGRIDKFAQQQAGQFGGQIDQVARDLSPRGRAVTPEQAGRAVVQGIEGPGGFIEQFRNRSDQLYRRLDDSIPAELPVPVSNALAYLEKESTPIAGAAATSELLSNPRLAEIAKALQTDVQAGNGNIPYEALARLRSQVGEAISDAGLMSDQPTRQLKGLYGALTDDLKTSADTTGPQARSAFDRANAYYAAGNKRLDDISHVIEKNGGPEKVFAAATSGVKDGATTLRQVMRSLPEDSQRELSSAFLRRMGRAVANQQDSESSKFSMNTFLTNWNSISPEARNVLFGRYGSGFAKDMQKIADAADAVKEGSRIFANPSGTARKEALIGQTVGTLATAGTAAATGNVGMATLALMGSASSAALSNAAARVVTNPRYVKWLSRATEMPVGSLVAQLNALRNIARDEGDTEMERAAEEMKAQATAAPEQ